MTTYLIDTSRFRFTVSMRTGVYKRQMWVDPMVIEPLLKGNSEGISNVLSSVEQLGPT